MFSVGDLVKVSKQSIKSFQVTHNPAQTYLPLGQRFPRMLEDDMNINLQLYEKPKPRNDIGEVKLYIGEIFYIVSIGVRDLAFFPHELELVYSV